MSARRYRVVYDEEVRRLVASLPAAGKQSLAELFGELTVARRRLSLGALPR